MSVSLLVYFLSVIQCVVFHSVYAACPLQEGDGSENSNQYTYRLLATTKTSTMQKEMNEAADEGFRLKSVMGGDTALGGSEVVVIMMKNPESQNDWIYEYKLLATTKTSTMQRELQEAADAGFEYIGQTVFSTTFSGDEVVVILERDKTKKPSHHQYRLLATSKTSTMQKELQEAGDEGFELIGMTVAETGFTGSEIVSIMRRKIAQP